MIVLDTNVLSELMRSTSNKRVVDWADEVRDLLFTTVITQAEIWLGLATMPLGRKKERLAKEADELFDQDFRGRVLTFDSDAARAFSALVANRRRIGRPIGTFDAQIAAIAVSRGASVATRNIADFEQCGVALINPWDARS